MKIVKLIVLCAVLLFTLSACCGFQSPGSAGTVVFGGGMYP